jgi:hypothetical protein
MIEKYSICDTCANVYKVFDDFAKMLEFIYNNYTETEWARSGLTADRYLDDNGYYAECLETYEIYFD